MYKKIIFLILFSNLLAYGQSEQLLLDPSTNKAFSPEKFSSVKGSPFLFNEPVRGNVEVKRGKYMHLDLNYNAYEDRLYFFKEGIPYEIVEQISTFTFTGNPDRVFVSNLPLEGNGFWEVLETGEISVYKRHIKLISELSSINQGVVKNFTEGAKYAVVKNNKGSLIKLSQKDLAPFLADKPGKNYPKLKKEKDLIESVQLYNTPDK